jgi:hypothetical protein
MRHYKLFSYLLFSLIFIISINVQAQTRKYKTHRTTTSHSKSCGSCGKPVSVNSRIGMTCPHCGVRWGDEHTTNRTTYDNSNDNDYTKPNYKSNNSYGYSNTKCVCGRTKSSSDIMCYKCRTTCVCGGHKDVSEIMCMKCRTTCVCGKKKNASDIMCLKCRTTCICGGYKDVLSIMCKKCSHRY